MLLANLAAYGDQTNCHQKGARAPQEVGDETRPHEERQTEHQDGREERKKERQDHREARRHTAIEEGTPRRVQREA